MTPRARIIPIVLAVAAATWAAPARAQTVPGIRAERVAEHTEFLTALGHRLSGTNEGTRAGDYIIRQLRGAGFEDVVVQRFGVTQIHYAPGDCYVQVGEARVPLQPLRPNGLALPVTGPEGIEGETVYLAAGGPESLKETPLAGRIAVMDYASGDAWVRAAGQGARAVILVGPARRNHGGPKWVNAHLPFPRFYVDRAAAEAHGLLAKRGPKVRLFSRMSYRPGQGRNIMVFIPAAGGGKGNGETVTLACEYDTFGPVPFLSPSPRKAANVAGLIELAAELRRNPLQRATAVIFFDNNAQAQAGQMAFHFARTADSAVGDEMKIPALLAGREAEAKLLDQRIKALGDPDALITAGGGGHRTWRNWLPTLMTGLALTAAVCLLGWLAVEFHRWIRDGLTPSRWIIARGVALLLAIGVFGAAQVSGAIFRILDEVAGAAGTDLGEVRGSERLLLLDDLGQRYDDLREDLADLRLTGAALDAELRKAEGDIEKWREANGAEQDLPAYLTNRLAGARKRLERDASAIKTRIEDGETLRRTLASVRIGVKRGQVPVDRAELPDPGLQDPAAVEAAERTERELFQSVLTEHARTLFARQGELRLEIDHLVSADELAERWRPRTLLAMLFVDLPADRSHWTVTVPAPTESLQYVYNQAAAKWVDAWSRDKARRRDCPDLAPVPANIAPEGDDAWRVSAQATSLLQVGSLGAARPIDCLPGAEGLDAAALAAKLRQLKRFVRQFAQREELTRVRIPPKVTSFAFNIPRWDAAARRQKGCYVRRYGGGSVDARQPVAAATVLIRNRTHVPADQVPPDRWVGSLTRTSHAGTFAVLKDRGNQGILIGALTDEQGRLRAITQLHPGKGMAMAGEWNAVGFWRVTDDNTLCMFDAEAIGLLGVRATPDFTWQKEAKGVRLLRAGNVDFPRMNLTGDRGVIAAHVNKPRRFKVLAHRPLLLNSTPADGPGDGYTLPDGPIDVPGLAAGDLGQLNESRLEPLRKHGIIQNDLEALHAKAEAHRAKAAALATRDPAAAGAHRAAALRYSSLVYDPIQETTKDLIQAVVILLLLAIPFAYAVERVVSGTPNIYRQISGFAAIFLAVFAILYLVHPAFQFATFPMLVLLSFVLIILSGLVIAILKAKFEHEIKKLQGIATSSHRTTRSARQTLAAAVAQGIASMRRRPLRTALTALTIVLLTFTIMFFASVSTERQVQKIYLRAEKVDRQVEIQLSGGRSMDPRSTEVLRLLWADRAESFCRRWAMNTDEQSGLMMPARMPAGGLVGVTAWVQIDPKDLSLYPALAEAIDGDLGAFGRDGGVLLPRQLAQAGPVGSEVEFLGRRWKVRGTFDPVKLRLAKSVSGASFVPPDVEEMRRLLKLRYPSEGRESELAIEKALRQLEPGAFPLIDAESILLLSDPAGGIAEPVTGLVLLPESDAAAEEIAAEAATLLNEPVVLAADGRIERVLYGQALAMSGLRKLIAPLILGGLLIFGTMLSSVSDRKKEIFTLSALGLAPVHVGVLFFAEAAVYSVMGGMGGYLLSQVFGKTVEWLSGYGWVTAPSMNYSSMNAMFSILLVMATVMASTIYPAMKAARSANPGIQRKWKMPRPDGEGYDFQFPFTVSQYDMIGLISFLEEYFLAHRDRTVGSFAADAVRVEQADGRFTLSATIWLQPFDQGVSQTFLMATEPSDIEGIDAVRVAMRRLAGSPVIWRRSNSTFIDDLRQQFIFWRTIDEEMVDHYHEATVKRFELAEPAEDADGDETG